jgi:uncharacterized protein YecT (DUF1311 family)
VTRRRRARDKVKDLDLTTVCYMRLRSLPLAALIVMNFPAPGVAQSGSDDVAAIRACIQGRTGGRAEACIDAVTKLCAEAEGNEYDSTMRDCRRREQKAWDTILNESYARLREQMPAKDMSRLRDAQRAWLKTRQRRCARFYQQFQGTMAHPMIAACENRETARRALFLLRLADRPTPGEPLGR